MSANIALVLKFGVGILVAIVTVFTCWRLFLGHLMEWLVKPSRKGFLVGFSRKIWLYFFVPIFLVIGSPSVITVVLKTREFFPMTELTKAGPYEFPGGIELAILPEVSWTLFCTTIILILVTCVSRILAQLYDKFPVDAILLSMLGVLASFIVVGFVDDRFYLLIADFILAPVYYPWVTISYISITILAALCTEYLIYYNEKF